MSAHPFDSANAEATAALRTLSGSLSDADLGVDLGGGWTVSMALAHLAYWDAWHLARWLHAVEAGELAPPPAPEVVTARANEALQATWRALPPAAAVVLALDAAVAMDAYAADLEADAVEAARANGGSNWVERAPHRLNHIEQISRALGRA